MSVHMIIHRWFSEGEGWAYDTRISEEDRRELVKYVGAFAQNFQGEAIQCVVPLKQGEFWIFIEPDRECMDPKAVDRRPHVDIGILVPKHGVFTEDQILQYKAQASAVRIRGEFQLKSHPVREKTPTSAHRHRLPVRLLCVCLFLVVAGALFYQFNDPVEQQHTKGTNSKNEAKTELTKVKTASNDPVEEQQPTIETEAETELTKVETASNDPVVEQQPTIETEAETEHTKVETAQRQPEVETKEDRSVEETASANETVEEQLPEVENVPQPPENTSKSIKETIELITPTGNLTPSAPAVPESLVHIGRTKETEILQGWKKEKPYEIRNNDRILNEFIGFLNTVIRLKNTPKLENEHPAIRFVREFPILAKKEMTLFSAEKVPQKEYDDKIQKICQAFGAEAFDDIETMWPDLKDFYENKIKNTDDSLLSPVPEEFQNVLKYFNWKQSENRLENAKKLLKMDPEKGRISFEDAERIAFNETELQKKIREIAEKRSWSLAEKDADKLIKEYQKMKEVWDRKHGGTK